MKPSSSLALRQISILSILLALFLNSNAFANVDPTTNAQNFTAASLQVRAQAGTVSVTDPMVWPLVERQLRAYVESQDEGLELYSITPHSENNSVTLIGFVPNAVVKQMAEIDLNAPFSFLALGPMEGEMETQLDSLPVIQDGSSDVQLTITHVPSLGLDVTINATLTGDSTTVLTANGAITGDPALEPQTCQTRMSISSGPELLTERTDVLTLDEQGKATMEMAWMADSGAFSFELFADAPQVVAEPDETDNVLSRILDLNETPQNYGYNLHLNCSEIRTEQVALSVSPNSPILHQLLRQTVWQAMGDSSALRQVRCYPWASDLCGMNQLFTDISAPFDLTVLAIVTESADRSDAAADLRAALIALPQVATAQVLTPQSTAWQQSNATRMATSEQLLAVGVQLIQPAPPVSLWWRVEVPVTSGPVGDGSPIDATVLFSIAGANSGPAYAVMDNLRVYPEKTAIATALLPCTGDSTIEIGVQARDRLELEDESDNHCAINATGGTGHAEPSFEVRAFLADTPVADASAAPVPTLHVIGRLSNPGDTPVHLIFSSSKQMDFTINDTYRWSDNKNFALAFTQVVVPPGESRTWHLTAKKTEILAALPAPDEAWQITAELSGTTFSAQTTLDPGDPIHILPIDGRDLFAQSDNNDGANRLPPLPLVRAIQDRGTQEADLPSLQTPDPEGDTVQIRLRRKPLNGELTQTQNGYQFQLQGALPVDELLALEINDGITTRPICRHLLSGIQKFTLHLDAGWNLVSLPIQPAAPPEIWLAQIPHGIAWGWQNRHYRQLTSLAAGEGFWLYSAQEMDFPFLGIPVADNGPHLFAPGWHLIGSINSGSIAPAQDNPLYGWAKETGYYQTTRVRPGEARWMKLSSPTQLDLP